MADLQELSIRLDQAIAVAPKVRYGGWKTRVSTAERTTSTVLYGSTYALAATGEIDLESGRFLTISDERSQTNVCVLGKSVAVKLFSSQDALGSYVHVGEVWCRVVGVLRGKGSALGFDYSDEILAPLSVVQRLPDADSQMDLEIHVLLPSSISDRESASRIQFVIHRGRQAENRSGGPFIVITGEALGNYLDASLKPVRLGLLALVLITLLIGGLGIMSVMLSTVRSRTAEIGLRRAIGASRAEIFIQFSGEAMAIALAGGVVGLALGLTIQFIIVLLTPFFGHFIMPFSSVATALLAAMCGGIFFGTWPALVAARMEPTDALRKR
ncbi:hypothetical protein ASG87_15640 [Frateuria sp. Soil773]|nr:hypothetical protein ASG87_15640 [Frateuria sp. Soil773]